MRSALSSRVPRLRVVIHLMDPSVVSGGVCDDNLAAVTPVILSLVFGIVGVVVAQSTQSMSRVIFFEMSSHVACLVSAHITLEMFVNSDSFWSERLFTVEALGVSDSKVSHDLVSEHLDRADVALDDGRERHLRHNDQR